LEFRGFGGGVGYQRFRNEDFEESVRKGVFKNDVVCGFLYSVRDGKVVEFDRPLFVISYYYALANDEDLFLFGKWKDCANRLLKMMVKRNEEELWRCAYFVVKIWMFSTFEMDRMGHSTIVEGDV